MGLEHTEGIQTPDQRGRPVGRRGVKSVISALSAARSSRLAVSPSARLAAVEERTGSQWTRA